MTSCDDFIEKAKRTLPELCTTKDLINLGIYKSDQAAYHARKNGLAADHFRMPHGTIVYPKNGIIELLEKSKYDAKGNCFDENYDTGRPYTKSTSENNKKGIRL